MKKTKLHILISLALTTLLLCAIFSEVSFAEFLEIIKKSNFSLILIYFLISFVSQIIRALRYRLILASVGQENLPSRFRFLIVTLIRSAFVDFLPARLGELSFLYVLNRYGIGLVRGATTFAVCMVLDIAVLLAIFMLFMFSSLVFKDQLTASLVSREALLAVVLVLLIISAAIYKLERVLSFFKKLIPEKFCKIHKLLTQIVHDTELLKEKRAFFSLLFLTFLLRLGKYSALYILLCAVISQWGVFVNQVSPLLTFVSFVAAEASASLPVSGLMGFGAYEAVWSFIFSLSNITIPSIPVMIFAIHIITQVVGYGLGAISFLAFILDQMYGKQDASS